MMLRNFKATFGLLSGLICLFLFVSNSVVWTETGWWNSQWKCCRIVEVVEKPDSENPAAEFSFAGGGYLKKDARDIVVLDKNMTRIPFQIIWSEPVNETTVIFPVTSKGERYSVYYGNPRALKTTPFPWKPEVSLTLETMENPGGEAGDFKEMKKLIKRSRKTYGRGFVDKIWHGLNPYGPNDNYLSIYRGYLKIAREGIYQIATASDEASFLFIDGKLITEWPGYHGVGGGLRGEHSGTLKLTRGLHRVSYYHQEGDGAQFMIAAWKRPGKSRLEIIPSSAYLHPARTREVSYKKLNQNLAACFKAKQESEMIKGDIQYTKIKFRNHSYDLKRRKLSHNWDFGDGVSSNEKSPSHIYTGVGNYMVVLTLRAGRKKDSFKFLIKIRESIRNLTASDRKSLNEYAQIINTYQHRKLTREQLLSYVNLLEDIDKRGYLIPICEAYLEKYDLHDIEISNRILWLLAEACEIDNPEKAVAVYARIAAREKNRDLVFKAEMACADTYLYKLKNYGRAMKVYKSLKNRFSSHRDRVKLARVRIGDVYGEIGEYEKAERIYAGIERETVKDIDLEEAIMRRGIYARRVESYLKQGQLNAALSELAEWEINFPMSKLSGELPLFYSEYFFRKGDYERVVSELTKLVKLNPETPFLSEAKRLIAEARIRIQDSELRIK